MISDAYGAIPLPQPGERVLSRSPAREWETVEGGAWVTVHLPEALRTAAGGSQLALQAPSVRALLEVLEHQYPSVFRCVCDETGAVRRHVNLFINSNHMRDCNGLDTTLAPGDVVTILPAVSGG